VCVAIVGRPNRMLQRDRFVCEVTRVASDGSTEHAASKALSAATRGALALGFRRVVTYTLLGEAGTCCKAANWRPVEFVKGRQWSRASRPRKETAQPGDKIRWEFGPDALPCRQELYEVIAESVGRVEIRPRAETSLPLFD
jgi:hypothetical protein